MQTPLHIAANLAKKLRLNLIKLFWRPIIRIQYEFVSRFDKDGSLTFLNYGYSDANNAPFPLEAADEPNRNAIQLYDNLLGTLDLDGKDVLEVGCGRGGGASYIMRYRKPRSVTGADFCKSAIRFCQTHYDIPGLSFVVDSAETLRMPPESFDVVLTVESSHCYTRFREFLARVRAILRPGGHFLLADFRTKEQLPVLRDLLHDCGMEVLRDEDITAQVFASLDQESDRKIAMIEERVPEPQKPSFRIFAAVRGTQVFDAFGNRDMLYNCFVLRKT